MQIVEGVPTNLPILLDGFPRTTSQINWLVDYTKSIGRDIDGVIHLHLPMEEAVTRLVERGRPDDSPDIIRKRYDQYIKEVVPLIDSLQVHGIQVVEIDGARTIEQIHEELSEKVK